MQEKKNDNHELKRTLGTWDLTGLGVAAILGVGVFTTIGQAASKGGPGVVFLFLFTAVACGFTALCYAQFASNLPKAGSAYSYAYASFGRLFAWILGWDLLLEYAISNIAISISWSRYFTGLLEAYGLFIPRYFTTDFLSAYRAFEHIGPQALQSFENLSSEMVRGYAAWMDAPRVFGMPIIFDLPALLITALVTAVVYVGIEESKKAANALVLLKIALVVLVIIAGGIYVEPSNWTPFAPHGFGGIMKGVSGVFFAYIGFDAISTTAEECKNPQRDLPRSMIYSLLICTTLYALVALVLTGVVHYSKLGVSDPLAFVFGPEVLNIRWISILMGFGGVISLSTVLLVYQIGQPRIWMAMSRDGFLPPIFASIHPRFRTPWFATILSGFLVAIPALFLNLTEVTDLGSIGSLFAFAMVCLGVICQDVRGRFDKSRFRVPYINARYTFPLLMGGIFALFHLFIGESGYSSDFWTKASSLLFALEVLILCGFSFRLNLSLIPVLGFTSCSYLLLELGPACWLRFLLWTGLGFLVYLFYASRIRPATPPSPT